MKYMPTNATFMRILLSLAVVLATAGAVATPAAAQSDQPDWAVQMFEDMGPMVETYNENVDPDDFGFLAGQLQGEKVILVVDDPANGTEATVSFGMNDDLQMQELALGTRDDATIRMETDKATMDRIIAANDPVSELRTAIENDEVTVLGIGWWPAAKWTVVNTVADVLRGIFG